MLEHLEPRWDPPGGRVGEGRGRRREKEDLMVQQSRDICAIHLQSVSSLSRWFDKDRERAVCLPKLSLSLVSSPFPPYLFSLQVMGLVFARTECCLRDSTPISRPKLANGDETKADMIVTTWIMDMIHSIVLLAYKWKLLVAAGKNGAQGNNPATRKSEPSPKSSLLRRGDVLERGRGSPPYALHCVTGSPPASVCLPPQSSQCSGWCWGRVECAFLLLLGLSQSPPPLLNLLRTHPHQLPSCLMPPSWIVSQAADAGKLRPEIIAATRHLSNP